MVKNLKMLGIVAAIATISCGLIFKNFKTGETVHAASQSAIQPFLGRWDLTLKTPQGELPSWLELTAPNGKLQATMVGRWGSAHVLPKIEIDHGTLTFVSPKEEESRKTDMEFTAKLVDGKLV